MCEVPQRHNNSLSEIFYQILFVMLVLTVLLSTNKYTYFLRTVLLFIYEYHNMYCTVMCSAKKPWTVWDIVDGVVIYCTVDCVVIYCRWCGDLLYSRLCGDLM